MERTPSEIWTEIFTHACTDSGETGRRLSLVSKFTRAASAPVKYQSIAVYGLRQIMAFRQLLLQTPPQLRHIKYLYLSTAQPISQYAFDHMSEAGRGVLEAVADSVEILYLDVPQDFSIWDFPRPFPRLVELAGVSIPPPGTGTLHRLTEEDITPFPQLRRCYFMCAGLGLRQELLDNIHSCAPAMTHLRFSGLQLEYTFPFDLTATTLPETIQLLYVKPGPPLPRAEGKRSLYQNVNRRLQELNSTDSRLVLLPAYISNYFGRPITVRKWEARVNGVDGCWSLRNRIWSDSNFPASDSSSSEEQKYEIY